MPLSLTGLAVPIAGTICLLILKYLVDKETVRARWKRLARVVDLLGNLALAIFILMFFLGSGAVQTLRSAAWIPQTREADIWAPLPEWPVGEIKPCFARRGPSGIMGFDCTDKPSVQEVYGEPDPHLFRVELLGRS